MRRLAGLLCLVAMPAFADGEEPVTFHASGLPAAIRGLHAPCAHPQDLVNFATYRVAGSTVYLASCPREAASSWPAALALRFDPAVLAEVPVAVYLAEGAGALRRLTFPVRLTDGTEASIGTLPANAEADHQSQDPRSPWIVTLWKPPALCKVRARWKVVDGQPELWLWEEAAKCTADDGPVYRVVLDRHPPRLSRE